MDRGAWWAKVHGVTELYMTEATQHSTCLFPLCQILRRILSFIPATNNSSTGLRN